MNYLQTGQFYGETNRTFHIGDMTLTDTEYTVDRVDWHYHENPYFTFVLDGRIIEGNRRATYDCPAGTLLFHNWQEPHYNIKPGGYTRGFQIEAPASWFSTFDLDLHRMPADIYIDDPRPKILFHNIYKETRHSGPDADGSRLAIEGLLLEVLQQLRKIGDATETRVPPWVKRVNEMVRETSIAHLSLIALSKRLDLHPIYLCRAFPRFFGCGFGEYIRRTRVERSLVLLRQRGFTLTEIAFSCGFADQSHFIRCFRSLLGITPGVFRKLTAG